MKRRSAQLLCRKSVSTPCEHCRSPGELDKNAAGRLLARNTIKNTLLAHGLRPAPERGKHTCWRTLLQSHLGAIAGADFFSVEVLTPFGLIGYFVLFVIDIGTRRVQIAGITS